jgi:hypothetical protein
VEYEEKRRWRKGIKGKVEGNEAGDKEEREGQQEDEYEEIKV